jgi:hypothetical protein
MITVEYHIPKFNSIMDKIEQERELISWCWKNFPDGNWVVRTSSVLFCNERDAVLFALRWL